MRNPVHSLIALALVAPVVFGAAPASAQTTDTVQPVAGFGWTLTPSFIANTTWDDNALVRGQGDQAPSDLVNVLNPGIEAAFKGRRGEFSGAYDGAFHFYRQLSDLNSYDQSAVISGRRLVTRHVTVFARNQLTLAPTTEQIELVGVPYIRTGSRNEYFQSGVEAALSKRLSLVASYNFQAVRFDQGQFHSYLLAGGHSHGGSVLVRRALSDRLALTTDYELQQATVGGVKDAFEIHRATGGVEHRLSEKTLLSVAGGFSHLATNAAGPARTGPTWRAGITREFQAGTLGVSYSRAFVPSYGFGGTQENEEFRANGRVPIGRAAYTQGWMAWRRNEPLVGGALKLHTLAVQASVGYMVAPWIAVEGFFDSSSQRIDMPGGASDHHRFGAQIVTTKPMRIR